jgi:hypothetical protein
VLGNDSMGEKKDWPSGPAVLIMPPMEKEQRIKKRFGLLFLQRRKV